MRLPEPHTSRAVLVGASSYGRPELPDLPCVAHNLTGVAGILADPRSCGLPAEHISVLADPSRPHATGSEIAIAAETAEDLLFVYLAGHLMLGGAGEPHLVLSGTPGSRRQTLGLSWVALSLANSRARTRVLVVDAHIVRSAQDPVDVSVQLLELAGGIADTSGWVFTTDDLAAYEHPGEAATCFTSALLGVVHRPLHAGGGLDLARLHAQTREMLALEQVRPPVLRLGGNADLALFRHATQPANPLELRRLRVLLDQATGTERHWYRPLDAANAWRTVLLTSAQLLGPDHPETLRARSRIAYWVGKADQPRTATRLYQRLHRDQSRVLGPRHQDTLITEGDIDYWSQQND